MSLVGLYVAQAIPMYLVIAALPPILRSRDVELSVIGGVVLLALPKILKPLWAPYIDRLSRHRRIGRKGIIVFAQSIVLLAFAGAGRLDPVVDLGTLFFLLMTAAFALATLDIATDGYAVEHLPEAHQTGGTAIKSGAAAVGVLIGGSGTLLFYDAFGWNTAVLITGMLSLAAVSLFLVVPESLGKREWEGGRQKPGLLQFFNRPGALAILAFALIFRVPEGAIRALEQPFLVDAGISLSMIGLVTGGSAAVVGLLGAYLGMLAIRRFGLVQFFVAFVLARSLLLATFGVAAMYSLPHEVLITLSVTSTFMRYVGLVGLFTAFMRQASLSQAGTDFTILSSATLLAYMIGSVAAGVTAQAFGYSFVFWFACALSIVTGGIAIRLLAGPRFGAAALCAGRN